MKKIVFAFLIPILVAAAPIPVLAQKQPIKVVSKAFVEKTIVNKQGEKELVRVPATKVLPGKEVIFVDTYVNEGKKAADQVTLKNPVPAHMVYVDGSATGEGTRVTYSVDGGKTFGPLAKLTVTGADGAKRPALVADVTTIRWQRTTPLAPGKKARVEFRARLK